VAVRTAALKTLLRSIHHAEVRIGESDRSGVGHRNAPLEQGRRAVIDRFDQLRPLVLDVADRFIDGPYLQGFLRTRLEHRRQFGFRGRLLPMGWFVSVAPAPHTPRNFSVRRRFPRVTSSIWPKACTLQSCRF
jgi:hypothetical protein